MNGKTFLQALLLTATAFSPLHAQTDTRDLEAIHQTLRYYMDGSTNGDSTMFAQAFLPESQMIFMREGKTNIVLLKDFVARMKPGSKADRQNRIVSVQVEGQAAQARLEIVTPDYIFHDFMTLLKTENGWKIVSKVFYRVDKPKSD